MQHPCFIEIIIPKSLNSMKIRTTDCSRTFDYQIKQIDELEKILHEYVDSGLMLFNLLLKLDLNGIKNLEQYYLRDLINLKLKKTTNIWDIRKLYKTIEHIKERHAQRTIN